MRLWLRLAIAMAVVSIVPLLFSSVVATREAATKAERSSAEILARDAGAIATYTATWIGDQGQAVAGWMQLFPLEAQSEAQREGLLRAVYRAVPAIVTVVLVDGYGQQVQPAVYLEEDAPAGDPLAGRTQGSDARTGELVARLPISEALARPGAAAVGTPYVPEGMHRPVVPIAAAGLYGERMVLGAEVDLSVLIAVVNERSSGARGIALLDEGGRAFVGAAHPLVQTDAVTALLGNDASVSYLASGVSVRGALSSIESLGWAAVVAEPAVIAERGANEIRQRGLEVVIAAMALALAGGFLIARTMSEPIDRLTHTALAVADGDLGQTVVVEGEDEIAQLAQAFNHMSRRLAEGQLQITTQREEIEAFNADLQQRVEERTAELERAHEALVRSGQLAAVAEMGAGLAHELNNPLASVLGVAQVLNARSDDPLVDHLVAEAERCRRVVEVMTRLSAADPGAGRADVLDFAEVLREILPPVRATARQRGVVVTLEELPDPLRVCVDRSLAGRAVVQLAHALTAGLGSGRTLSIGAEPSGDTIRVHFSPDVPVDEGARRDDFLAAGVSLWVARKLVDRLQGTLQGPTESSVSWVLSLPVAP
ncbi:MAG: HAMP domain-containing protein [Proteobacteria bacterium]|nr:HAMP domain-containing protein [Pseudomonadota bacterium]